MRFIMVVSVPTEAGNQLMKDLSRVKTLEDYPNTIKFEAAYFRLLLEYSHKGLSEVSAI